jgi:hypothetical protein
MDPYGANLAAASLSLPGQGFGPSTLAAGLKRPSLIEIKGFAIQPSHFLSSTMYVLIPKWLQTPYGYGESPNAKYFVSLPLSIRGLPIWLRGLCFWPSI